MALILTIKDSSVTFPASVLKGANLKEGSKVAVKLEGSRLVIENSFLAAWHDLQNDFLGAAEEAGFESEQDVIDYCKEIRRELNAKRAKEREERELEHAGND